MNNIDQEMKHNIRLWNENTVTPCPNEGKHMICNICDIQKIEILSDLSKIADIIDIICQYNGYNATQSTYNNKREEDGGCTLMYILTDGYHLSIHTFPEKRSIAFDLYTSSNQYSNCDYNFILIYEFLVEVFEAGVFTSTYNIMIREFE